MSSASQINPDGEPLHIPIFVSYSGQGGVEVVTNNLCMGLSALGQKVELLLIKDRSSHLRHLPAHITRRRVGPRHTWGCVTGLASYLRQARPPLLVAVKDQAIQVAVLARSLARLDTPIVGQVHTHMGSSFAARRPLSRWFRERQTRFFYRRVNCLIGVSEGVAEDLRQRVTLPASLVHSAPSPVVHPDLATRAQEPADHPWLEQKDCPVLIAVGRFGRQKDFPNLLHAFAQFLQHRRARLIILGEGSDRPALESLCQQLGIQDHVAMPGFVENPYAWMSRADLFVLSSRWEGSPLVLMEAMALGLPAVSTNCPSGPFETLEGGRWGYLVPVEDSKALAAAMRQSFESPRGTRETRMEWIERRHGVKAASEVYLDLFRRTIATTRSHSGQVPS